MHGSSDRRGTRSVGARARTRSCWASCSTAASGATTPGRAAGVLAWAGAVAQLERVDRAAGALGGRGAVRRIAVLRAAIELGRRASASPLGTGDPVRDAGVNVSPN